MERMLPRQSRSSKISSVDNISAVLKHKRSRAVFPLVCADHAAWLAQIDFEMVATDPHTLARVIKQAYLRYNYDMVLLFSDAYVEAQAMGCPVRLSPFPTLNGSRTAKRTDRTEVMIEAARILKTTVSVPVFVSIKGPFSLASFLTGIQEFLKMVLKDPSAAQEILQEALDFQLSYIVKLLRLGVHLFIGDPVASASVISPELFSLFAFKPLKTLIETIKHNGSIAGIHICGDTASIAKQLDSIGADILSIEDITVHTDTIKMGGISTNTIRYGSFKDISNEIDATRKEPYLILSTSCDVPIETPPENILHLIKNSND